MCSILHFQLFLRLIAVAFIEYYIEFYDPKPKTHGPSGCKVYTVNDRLSPPSRIIHPLPNKPPSPKPYLTNFENEPLLDAMKEVGYDGRPFCEDLEMVCDSRKKRGKSNRKNRYDSYLKWAIILYKKNIGTNEIDSPKYAYPDLVLKYIRDIVYGDIKGEIHIQ